MAFPLVAMLSRCLPRVVAATKMVRGPVSRGFAFTTTRAVSTRLPLLLSAMGVAGGGPYWYQSPAQCAAAAVAKSPSVDYKAVKKAITDILDADDSLAPFFIRLAWHSSGKCFLYHVSFGSSGGILNRISLLLPTRNMGSKDQNRR